MRSSAFAGALVLVLASTIFATADEPAIVFTNATVYTGTGAPLLEKATLIVRDGKIVSVNQAELPAGAKVTDLKGAVIIPGLVDTHSHIGLYGKPGVSAHSDGNEMSGPVQGIVRAVDSIWPGDPGIRMALAGGVTTANIMPGSGNVIGGQTLYCKLRGDTVEEMQLTGKLPDGTIVLGGLKMANGENPKGYGRNKSQAPFTRMKVAALQRTEFVKAKEYQRKWQEYRTKKDAGEDVTEPTRDLALEPLVEALEHKRTVHFHCHRADDLVTAIRLSEEFGFELVLQHATEGYLIADLLAAKKIPVSLTLIDSPGGKAECVGILDENAAVLDKAGVPVTINTDDFVTESRFYLRTGAIAVRGGMSEAKALQALTLTAAKVMHLDHRTGFEGYVPKSRNLRAEAAMAAANGLGHTAAMSAITLDAAKLLGIDKEYGSIEVGKKADLVLYDGDPFEHTTHVTHTVIDGKVVFDRSAYLALPFERRILPLLGGGPGDGCCLGW